MKTFRLFSLALFALFCGTLGAQKLNFERTLRLDYIFAGDVNKQEISLEQANSFAGWAGRRHHLDQTLVPGSGTISMRDAKTGKLLYTQGFSTLFQEWLQTEEATQRRRAYENVFLLPMPTDTVLITVNLRDMRQHPLVEYTHQLAPNDELIHNLDGRKPAEHKYLLHSGSSDDCIDIAMVAEGFTEAEFDEFYASAQEAMDALFAHAPFDSLKGRFNVVAVAVPSKDSGVSIPQKGIWKETPFGSHFKTFYVDRYLTTCELRNLHDALIGIPYEHIMVLANTEKYGGGGIFNAYTLATTKNAQFRPVVVHEFGHSFAWLADEYADAGDAEYEPYYTPNEEPLEANLTTLKDFSKKWNDLLTAGVELPTPDTPENAGKVGLFEGGGYQFKGVYRPCRDCRMRTNEYPTFCPVCQRAIAKLIDFYTKE